MADEGSNASSYYGEPEKRIEFTEELVDRTALKFAKRNSCGVEIDPGRPWMYSAYKELIEGVLKCLREAEEEANG